MGGWVGGWVGGKRDLPNEVIQPSAIGSQHRIAVKQINSSRNLSPSKDGQLTRAAELGGNCEVGQVTSSQDLEGGGWVGG